MTQEKRLNPAVVALYFLLLALGVAGFYRVDQIADDGAARDARTQKQNRATAERAEALAERNLRFLQGKSGLPGVRGRSGTIGGRGPTGNVGPAGRGGPRGRELIGARGPLGPLGPTGRSGAPGAPGSSGGSGPSGGDGPSGPQGDTGPQGATGPQGPPAPSPVSGTCEPTPDPLDPPGRVTCTFDP